MAIPDDKHFKLPTPGAFLSAALAAALAVSCSEDPTAPPAHTVHRTTAIVIHDSLGTPAEGATVRLVAEFDSAGIAPVVIAMTDGAGIAVAVLMQGAWGVHGLGAAQKVAGATFSVPGLTRPEIDTIVVRLTLHTPSVAQGRALLGLGSVHEGTIVACPPAPSIAVTDSSGAFVLNSLPLGRWTITMHHPGFRLGLADIEFTTPGVMLTVADVHLIPRSAPSAYDRTLSTAAD